MSRTGGLSLAPVAAALLVGLTLCLPELLIIHHRRFYQTRHPETAARWSADGGYAAAAVYDDPDTGIYAGRISEAARKKIPFDPNILGNRSARLATTDILSFLFLGSLVRLAGGFDHGLILIRFVCGVLWFLGPYLLSLELGAKPRFALAWSVILCLFADMWCMRSPVALGILSWLRFVGYHSFWVIGNFYYTLGPTHLPNPLLTYPVVFLTVYAFVRALRVRSALSYLAAGLAGGCLAYVHVDIWTTVMGAVPVFLVASGAAKRRLDLGISAAFLISLAVALPYVLTHLSMSGDMLSRLGVRLERFFDPDGLVFFLGAGLCWLFLRKDPGLLFMGSILGAVALLVESQLLTGKVTANGHWTSLGDAFGLILAGAVISRKIEDRRDFLWGAALALLLAMTRGAAYASHRFPFQGLPKDIEGGLAFLAKNTPPDSVLVTLGPLETLLAPIYSHNKTLMGNAFPMASDLPLRDYLQRMRRAAQLYGVPEAALLASIPPELTWPNGRDYVEHWDWHLWKGSFDWVGREIALFEYVFIGLNQHERALGILRALGTSPPPRDFQADYLWVGPFESSLLKGRRRDFGVPLYANPTVSIFKL